MRRRLLAACLVAALAGWHLALRASSWRLPLNSDEGEYSYAARVWSEGGLPYRDASTQKPPMILWLYRLALAVSGSLRAPRALGILAALATAALLAGAVPRGWPGAARAAPAAAFLALSTLPVGDFGLPANTETFIGAFAALAALAVSRGWEHRERLRWPALAGLACGAAFMTKQTALYSCGAFGALAAWSGAGRLEARRAGAFLLGAAAIPLAWGVYFAARGGLDVFLDDAYRGNLSYVSVVGAGGLAEQARWLSSWLGPALLKAVLPAGALSLWGLGRLQARWAEREAVLAVLWLGTALAGVMTGLYFFPHYFLQAAAPLCLCASFGVERLRRARGARAAWGAVAALALWPAVGYASFYAERDPELLAKRLLYPNPLVEARRAGQLIAAATKPEDTIYVFGSEPQIYVYAGRRDATPVTFVYMLTLRKPRPGRIDGEVARLRASRPAFVVYSRQPLSSLIAHREGLRFRDEVRAWLVEEYHPVGELLIEPRGFRERGPRDLEGRPADFGPADSLLLFARRER